MGDELKSKTSVTDSVLRLCDSLKSKTTTEDSGEYTYGLPAPAGLLNSSSQSKSSTMHEVAVESITWLAGASEW